ncbi:hypothetical protein V6N11_068587 [Hibiscus sabdariffa]|uniref:Uncharacterized protein n=1 Tax=Hibiscus sabdariffa TaxID=183260 RepID=A0ABR2PAI2_9ROSI
MFRGSIWLECKTLFYYLCSISFLLAEKPGNLPGLNSPKLLGAFEMVDAQWLAMQASYMEFNVLYLSLLKQCFGTVSSGSDSSPTGAVKVSLGHSRIRFPNDEVVPNVMAIS